MKFINLTEYGSKIVKTVSVDKINFFQEMTLKKTNEVVTLITFINKTDMTVYESKVEISKLIG